MKKNFLKWATLAFAFTMGSFMFTSCGDDDDDDTPPPTPVVDPSSIAKDNLIAYFPFEGNGNDAIGGMTAVEEKNATYPTGKRGKAYFGGGAATDQAYLKYTLTSTSKLSTLKATTFAFWANIKWTGDGGQEPMIYQINGTNDAPWGNFSLKQNRTTTNDSINFCPIFVKDGVQESSQKIWNYSSNRLIYGTWIHIAVTYDNVSSKFYIYANGKVIDLGDENSRWADNTQTTPLGDLNFANPTAFVIGAWADNVNQVPNWAPADSFKGGLDEMRIYDRALTATEVQELYDAEFENMN